MLLCKRKGLGTRLIDPASFFILYSMHEYYTQAHTAHVHVHTVSPAAWAVGWVNVIGLPLLKGHRAIPQSFLQLQAGLEVVRAPLMNLIVCIIHIR